MCTVTFIPLANNDFILTSNRDESKFRETIHPKKYVDDGVEMIYPKDKIAGGTWIGISSQKRLVCVLNGAFEKHIRKDSYKKSRGVIAKEILRNNNIEVFINNVDLNNIEPFTIIIVDWNNVDLLLFELIWDGVKRYITKLKNEPKIWSSSTLYSNEIREIRKKWFQQWLNENELSSKNILKFHHSEIGEKEQSILMKRPNVETVSITSVKKEDEEIEMLYEDMVHSLKSKLKV